MQRFSVVCPLVVVFLLGTASAVVSGGESLDQWRISDRVPLEATYIIENRPIPLSRGRFEAPAAPGSAAKIQTTVFGRPAYGDLDGDGDLDVALVLVHSTGGSGTFYYVAVAIRQDDNFEGTNAVWIGDRIAPLGLEIRYGVLRVEFTDRRQGEPMAAAPTVDRSMDLAIENGILTPTSPLLEGEQRVPGWVIIGHEVRSLRPCQGDIELWILGSSPIIEDMIAAYRNLRTNAKLYTALFMVVDGKLEQPPVDGFGKHYEGAFYATRVVRIVPGG
jgi:hypothetical protein